MTHSDGLTSRVIRQETEWDAIQPDWDALYAACPLASPPMDFVWLRLWWRVYGDVYGSGGLRIVTVWRATRLIGVLPLYVSTGSGGRLALRTLRFISTGEAEEEEICPEYLGLLCLPEEEAACHAAVWAEIGRLTWDHLELLDLSAQSPLLTAGTLPIEATVFSRGASFIADLAGGFEAYLGRLSHHGRRTARRLLREGERAGARLEIVTPDRGAQAFDDLRTLHQERWKAEGQPGVFSAKRFVDFHQGLIQAWQPAGRAVIARLWLSEEPVVVLYGFVSGQKFDFYQSGVRFDVDGQTGSPGILAILLLMQALADRHLTAFDFLRGPAAHKTRLATAEHLMVGVSAVRPTFRGTAFRMVQTVATAVRKYFRTPTGVAR